MPLQSLKTYQFRNLQGTNLELDPGLQIVYGENASGKTSLLDAMHLLCSGKSFLGVSPRKLQQFNTDSFSINGDICHQRRLNQHLQFRWQDSRINLMTDHQIIHRASDYAAIQPVQAITPLSYRLLDDSPDIRRRFIDWGVFHVKHDYIDTWRRFQRSLAQRNAMLTDGSDARTLSAWSHEYVQLSQLVDQYRSEYINELRTALLTPIEHFLPGEDVSISYQRGWDINADLETLLIDNYRRDSDRHFTYYGPQRAELSIRFNNKLAKDVVSRGQKKLITFALYLSQAQLQQSNGQRAALLLIDDLPSELDREHQEIVLALLNELPSQVVLSCIDLRQLEIAEGMAKKLFHVKQGYVKEVLQ